MSFIISSDYYSKAIEIYGTFLQEDSLRPIRLNFDELENTVKILQKLKSIGDCGCYQVTPIKSSFVRYLVGYKGIYVTTAFH